MAKQKNGNMLSYLAIGKSEVKLFNILSKQPMTIKQIIKFSKLSERTIRTCLTDLVKKQFVKKEAIIEGQLKYLYHTNSTKSIIDNIQEKLSEFEKASR
ncbi:MAG: BlaI/MecI/CopY family transcriptional regulator [Candidatus Aenigmarchaeota archaeon]|nr:BlaI/MecI/CopY family transcriptional regulator [Candidatus Aenigmarchaeota archaeon]